jgi:hypothetical protein
MNNDLCANLESTLAELIAAHEELLAVIQEQRAAISRADGVAVEATSFRQRMCARRIADIETRRQSLVAALSGARETTLTQISMHLAEPLRTRIAALAQRLREVLVCLQEQNRVLGLAARVLVGHVDGLMQQVSRRLGEAGTYGRQGRLSAGPIRGGLDMRY